MTPLNPTEGFIDVRFVLDRAPGDTFISRIDRMGYLLPAGTTAEELQNIIMSFWEYPRELSDDLAEAFKSVPTKETNE